jgi:hypothetical protein
MWLQADWHFFKLLHLAKSMTITNFLPAIPILAASFDTAGKLGTGFKKALSISMTSPSTDKSFTISPDGFASIARSSKGFFFVEHPAKAKPANNPVARNSRRELSFVFIN